MERSQYLAQALQSMGQPQRAPTYQGPDLGQMQDQVQRRQAWETANPGQSYMAHGLQQMGQNIMGAPGRVMQAGQNLAGLPGQLGDGFQNFVKGLPGFGG